MDQVNPNLPSVPYMARLIVEQNPSKLRINTSPAKTATVLIPLANNALFIIN